MICLPMAFKKSLRLNYCCACNYMVIWVFFLNELEKNDWTCPKLANKLWTVLLGDSMGPGWPWTTAFSSRCSPKSNVHQHAFSPWFQMLFSRNHRKLSNCLWQSLDQQWADFLSLKLWKQFAQTQPSFIFPNTIQKEASCRITNQTLRLVPWTWS